MNQFKEFLQERFAINEADWQLISGHFEERQLTKESFFVRQGSIPRNAGFILEGVMRYFGYEDNGEEQTCYFAAEQDYVIDPFSFPAQSPATTFNLQLVTDCRVAVITYDKDKSLTKSYPHWTNITNALIQRAMAEFLNQKKVISYDAGKRYEYFVEHYPQFAQRLPLQYIASYLGIAQPSLSRLRKKLAGK